MDLSRKRLDFHLLDESRPTPPLDADGLRGLAERVGCHGQPIRLWFGRDPIRSITLARVGGA